jgi:diacylglycerol kinase family enzyme
MSVAAPRQVVILANPRAGADGSRRQLDGFVLQLSKVGLRPTVCWHRAELAETVTAARADLCCVVAAGGDGTLLEVLNRAPDVPVALLPLGTENLVAGYCRTPRSGQALADSIQAGRWRQMDAARVNERTFCLMASAGFDAAVVHRVHSRRRGHITRLGYALPIIQTLQEYRFPTIDVEVTDTGERLRGSLAFVFNLPCYGLGLPIAREARPDDGLLDLYLFEKPGVFALARYALAVLGGRHQNLPDVVHRRARGFRLSSEEPVPIQIDGDAAGWLPATIEVLPRRLTLLMSAPCRY